jgi:glycosyltransferase involved in cell wall biosynthesis
MPYSQPLVSIGMPVYNGEEYIRQALDSLLAQDYRSFELSVSDNASTDGTAEICRFYCAQDQRIRYYRNPTNIGFSPNWQRVLELASSELFMWAAHDDCWSPNYIRTLVDCLLANPQAILAAGRILFIDANGDLCDIDPDNAPARDPDGNLGTAKQLLRQHATNWLHGLYRKGSLSKFLPTFFAEDPWGSDVLFLLEICLAAEVVGSNEAIMYKRVAGIHGPQQTPRQRVKWLCWYSRALRRRILHSSLPLSKKAELLHTYALYLKWLYFKRGPYSFVKLWGRAGYHWLIGMD